MNSNVKSIYRRQLAVPCAPAVRQPKVPRARRSTTGPRDLGANLQGKKWQTEGEQNLSVLFHTRIMINAEDSKGESSESDCSKMYFSNLIF